MQCVQRPVECFAMNSMACNVVRDVWSSVMNSMACNVVRDGLSILSRTAWHAMCSETCGMFCHEQHGMQCGQRRVECFVMNSMACNVLRDQWNVLSWTAWHAMWSETCGVPSRTAWHAMWSETCGMFCHEQHGVQCGQRRVDCFIMNSMACNVARDVWNVLS